MQSLYFIIAVSEAEQSTSGSPQRKLRGPEEKLTLKVVSVRLSSARPRRMKGNFNIINNKEKQPCQSSLLKIDFYAHAFI